MILKLGRLGLCHGEHGAIPDMRFDFLADLTAEQLFKASRPCRGCGPPQ